MIKKSLWQRILEKLDAYLQKKAQNQKTDCCSGAKKGGSSCCS